VHRIWKGLWLGALLVLLTAVTTYQITAGFYQVRLEQMQAGFAGLGAAENFADLLQTAAYIQEQALQETTAEELVQGAIDGMVGVLGDRYSVYLPASEYQDLCDQTAGSFTGVGIVLELQDGVVTVVAPMPGTPGEKAGLLPKDEIRAVDGRDVAGLSLAEVAALITGPADSEVRLTIARAGREFDVAVRRARIDYPTLESEMLAGRTGYLRLFAFNERSADLTEQALQDLRRQGMEKLILDLRHNPGGLLEEALLVAEMLVPEGPLVILEDGNGFRLTHSGHGDGLGLPLAVLVDEGSASAAEIVAGAVRDRQAGVLVGTRTFGKGTVQSVFDLDSGAGLKLTSGRFLTPAGLALDGEGLQPDVVVAAGEDAADDRQLAAAWALLNR